MNKKKNFDLSSNFVAKIFKVNLHLTGSMGMLPVFLRSNGGLKVLGFLSEMKYKNSSTPFS